MADEITISFSMRCINGELSFNLPATAKTFDQTTARAGTFTVDVGTSEETLSTGDLAGGFVSLVNLDATNYVEVGFATGVYPIKLRAESGPLLVELNGSPTIYLKANTAACKVQAAVINA